MEIEISGKLTAVPRGQQKYTFPACSIMRTGQSWLCYLNAAARRVWSCDKGVNWYQNDGNVIAMPSDAVNAYQPIKKNGILSGYTFPQILLKLDDGRHNGNVKPGVYRLYKCKSGFAFQPYKPLAVKED